MTKPSDPDLLLKITPHAKVSKVRPCLGLFMTFTNLSALALLITPIFTSSAFADNSQVSQVQSTVLPYTFRMGSREVTIWRDTNKIAELVYASASSIASKASEKIPSKLLSANVIDTLSLASARLTRADSTKSASTDGQTNNQTNSQTNNTTIYTPVFYPSPRSSVALQDSMIYSGNAVVSFPAGWTEQNRMDWAQRESVTLIKPMYGMGESYYLIGVPAGEAGFNKILDIQNKKEVAEIMPDLLRKRTIK